MSSQSSTIFNSAQIQKQESTTRARHELLRSLELMQRRSEALSNISNETVSYFTKILTISGLGHTYLLVSSYSRAEKRFKSLELFQIYRDNASGRDYVLQRPEKRKLVMYFMTSAKIGRYIALYFHEKFQMIFQFLSISCQTKK